MSSDGWNGILPQGNFQTSRTLEEMCTKKWRLGGKIKKLCKLRWCIWFVNNKACYFTKIVAHDFRYGPRILSGADENLCTPLSEV